MSEAAVEWNDRERSAVLRPGDAIDRPRVASLWAMADGILASGVVSRFSSLVREDLCSAVAANAAGER